MKVGGRFHLTYCSNIHPGETWQEVRDALASSLPQVRRRLAFDGPFALGLRLSAQAAETLEQPGELDRFRRFLRAGDYYVLTINGFPYGAFHRQRVKENVYLPDWRDAARLQYTNRLARLLAELLRDRLDIEGSVSTVPGAFSAHVGSDADVTAMAAQMLQHTATLKSLREETGATITLAIEPEPACYIETVAGAIRFFRDHLFNEGAIAAASRRTGLSLTVEDVRRHLGLCFDTCHMAVAFEEPATAIQRLREAGIRVCKIQVSSALRLDGRAGAGFRAALASFAEDTYLHQVVERTRDGLVRYTDLPEALAAAEREPTVPREWRVHFHVPVFLADLGAFETTQPYLVSVLDALKRDTVCPYLEVETYTWDVLPSRYRTVDVCSAIARELSWVRSQLES